jgi:hypothetical protein
VEQNVAEAKEFCRQIIASGNVPVCPQIWLPEFLDDSKPEERERALNFCKIMLERCDRVYAFLGEDNYISSGMRQELEHAERVGLEGKTDFIKFSDPLRGKYRKMRYQEEINILVSVYKEIPTSLHNSALAKALDTAIKVLKEEK